MLRYLRLVIPLMLVCSMVSLGAGEKGTPQKGSAVVAPELPVGPTSNFTPSKRPPRTQTASVGVYTGNEGWWDWQSNGGSVRHIEVDSASGLIHAIHMIGLDSATQNAARRINYARSTDDGVTWTEYGTVPDGLRSGYGNLSLLKSGLGNRPLIANHNAASGDLSTQVYFDENTPPAAPLWSSPAELIPGVSPPIDGGEAIWPWVAGTSDGSVVVTSSVNATNTATDPANYTNRQDNTLAAPWTFPGWHKVPILGAAARGSIAASDNHYVGVQTCAVFDTVIFDQSTDDGATWTASIQYPKFRVSGAESLATYIGWDLVYHGNDVYACFASANTQPADATFSPGTGRIEFWSAATGFVEAAPSDTLLYQAGSGSSNHATGAGWPSIGLSGDRILIAYTVFENNAALIDPYTGATYGEIYVVQSTDGGTTWTQPANLTKTPTIDERYASVSRWNEPDKLNITWTEDMDHAGASLLGSILDGPSRADYARQVFYKVDLLTLFPPDDIKALSIVTPAPAQPFKEGVPFTPQASFRNVGLAAQTSIDVRFEILNSVPAVVYTSNRTIATMASGATEIVSFDAEPGLLADGPYTTRAIAMLAGDLDITNDTTTSSVQIIPVVVVPSTGYSTDFESPGPEGGFTGWHTATIGGGSSDWVLGTPAKLQISHAHSGTNAWVTKLVDNHSSNKMQYVGSPVLNLSAISGNVTVEFWQNFVFEHNWDGAVLQYSTNSGATWEVADHTLGSGPNFDTPISAGWYVSNVDTGGPSNGTYTPPYWTDSTTVGASSYTNNDDGWIRSSTVIPVGGLTDVRLRWVMEADASSVREGWAIDDVSILSANATVGVGIAAGWNMVSNPANVVDDAVSTLYPTSLFTYGFRFDPATGYQQSTTMDVGTGYWAKFPGATTNNISGGPINSYGVPVVSGWNMVGSITESVDTSSITSTPAGIRASDWFGFAAGYTASEQIVPGKAYWVKASAPGTFFMSNVTAPASRPGVRGVSLADNFNSITIKDAKGASQTLYFGASDEKSLATAYELPPVPPSGAFDVRFDSKNGGQMLKTHALADAGVELAISISSAVYPLEISWNIKNDVREYVIADGFGGIAVAPKTMRTTGSMKVTNSAVSKLVIRTSGTSDIPTEFALLRNYPNPFNPSTNVKFALPLQSKVNIEIYNVLGQRVRTLVNEEIAAGYHVVEWNGRNDAGQQLSSGVYLLKISATNNQGRSFSDIQKLMMLK